jgi:hypothetical protein
MDPPDFVWIQAQEESRPRLAVEQRDANRVTALDKERLELRSHVLSLREGKLDSRLHDRDRDRTIEDLNLRLRELRGCSARNKSRENCYRGRSQSCNLPARLSERSRLRLIRWPVRTCPISSITTVLSRRMSGRHARMSCH